MSDENPIVAYLAGDTSVSLSPAELAEMEKIRIALADGAAWVEPVASLQQRIIEAVAADVAATPSRAAETSTPPRQPDRGLLGVPYRDTVGTECIRNSSAQPNPERLADSRQSDRASAPGQR